MPTEEALPNLATNAPLWLALLTVGVNALVGALRGHSDDSRHWDIVGVAVFALLMGLGGGFIRDMLLGNLPATSLRDPWSLATVLVAVGIVLVIGHHLAKAATVMSFLDGLALGLFAVTGTEYGLAFDLPYVSAILLGAISAVGGGMLVSVLQGQTPEILLAGAPTALLAVAGSADLRRPVPLEPERGVGGGHRGGRRRAVRVPAAGDPHPTHRRAAGAVGRVHRGRRPCTATRIGGEGRTLGTHGR